MPAETPRNVLKYTVRSEKGKFVLSATPEEERLTVPARVASFLGGLVLAACGLGLSALFVARFELHPVEVSGLIGLGIVVAGLLAIAAFGLDLLGRGIVGRQWSRRFWKAVEPWVVKRVKPWHCGVALLLIFGVPVLEELLKQGSAGLASLMFPVAVLVQIILHEAGHLSAAGAVGYRPRWLIAGPVAIDVGGARPRLSLSRSWTIYFGGLATFEPVGRTRGKDLWVVAAGPLTNLLLSGLAFQQWGWPDDPSFLRTFLRGFIWMGFAIGLFNLIPLPRTASGVALDGRELLDLLRGRR
jgi:hypothetical protein